MSRGNVLLKRVMRKRTLTVEKFDPTTIDEEASPVYLPGEDIQAVARRQEEEVIDSEGNKIMTDFTIWTPVGQAIAPEEKDRISWTDPHTGLEEIFIGVRVKRVERLKGQVHHHKTLCRRE